MTTAADLVQKVIRRLSLVPGTGVQVYAEERIALMLEHTYDVVIEDLWWPNLMRWHSAALTGNGTPEGAITGLRTARDVKHVYYASDPRPLPVFIDRNNPTPFLVQNERPCWWEPLSDGGSMLRVLPFGTVGDRINVRYRTRLAKPFTPNTDIPIDEQLMVLGATYDFLEDDATSPGAAAKFASFFNARLQQLKTKWNDDEIYVGDGDLSMSPNGWQEV